VRSVTRSPAALDSVCTTHLESFSPLGSPLALNDLFLGYSYLEGGYECL
jgi:hypothetical protein